MTPTSHFPASSPPRLHAYPGTGLSLVSSRQARDRPCADTFMVPCVSDCYIPPIFITRPPVALWKMDAARRESAERAPPESMPKRRRRQAGKSRRGCSRCKLRHVSRQVSYSVRLAWPLTREDQMRRERTRVPQLRQGEASMPRVPEAAALVQEA